MRCARLLQCREMQRCDVFLTIYRKKSEETRYLRQNNLG